MLNLWLSKSSPFMVRINAHWILFLHFHPTASSNVFEVSKGEISGMSAVRVVVHLLDILHTNICARKMIKRKKKGYSQQFLKVYIKRSCGLLSVHGCFTTRSLSLIHSRQHRKMESTRERVPYQRSPVPGHGYDSFTTRFSVENTARISEKEEIKLAESGVVFG
jgi:hypothetical protein